MAAAVKHTASSDASWTQRAAIGAAVLVALGLLVWGVSQIKMGSGGAPKRQTVKITLPDTPPPPPPKPEEKKPEPEKQEAKPTPQIEPKQVEAPPQPAQSLKMDGAAGDGPSAFSAGSVSKDYTSGQASTGPASTGTGSDRAKYQFYINSTKQMLKDEIERHLQTDRKQLVVSFALWIKPDGSVDRYDLSPTGDERADQDIQAAFAQMARSARLPAPKDTPQPLRLRMTLLPPAS
jgi:hypothetical protein